MVIVLDYGRRRVKTVFARNPTMLNPQRVEDWTEDIGLEVILPTLIHERRSRDAHTVSLHLGNSK